MLGLSNLLVTAPSDPRFAVAGEGIAPPFEARGRERPPQRAGVW